MEAIFWIGMIFGFVGSTWLLLEAFTTGIWWGLATLFFAPAGLLYVINHWDRAKKPFLVQLFGTALVLIFVFK
ncbi:hypothetical protein HS961_12480 [Comamonas piscis]|uniref:Uncharacterized protein n=1 Tax=Comamonas piscis TaxID=1562974 RepID=A0A7G5EHV1_9BURK|nr:hypothetical protein [Comamonas piscis]QMV73576.1 hypothetical protein HS961_12480 [Comamonas piscis]WSO31997.1 hypothetical protein VUJ63_12515 [Comamonas piscis]